MFRNEALLQTAMTSYYSQALVLSVLAENCEENTTYLLGGM